MTGNDIRLRPLERLKLRTSKEVPQSKFMSRETIDQLVKKFGNVIIEIFTDKGNLDEIVKAITSFKKPENISNAYISFNSGGLIDLMLAFLGKREMIGINIDKFDAEVYALISKIMDRIIPSCINYSKNIKLILDGELSDIDCLDDLKDILKDVRELMLETRDFDILCRKREIFRALAKLDSLVIITSDKYYGKAHVTYRNSYIKTLEIHAREADFIFDLILDFKDLEFFHMDINKELLQLTFRLTKDRAFANMIKHILKLSLEKRESEGYRLYIETDFGSILLSFQELSQESQDNIVNILKWIMHKKLFGRIKIEGNIVLASLKGGKPKEYTVDELLRM